MTSSDKSEASDLLTQVPRWLRPLLAPVISILNRSVLLQKIVANTGWLIMEKAISMAIGFFVTIWVIRYLGPELFGKFSYAMSMAGLFGAIATLGLDNIVIRNLVRGDADKGKLLATTAALKFFGGFVAAGLALGSALLLGQDPETLLLVGAFGVAMIFSSLGVPDLWFQARVESKYSVGVRLITLLCSSLAKIALILAGASLIAFAVISPLSALLSGILFVVILRRKISNTFRWRPHLDLARNLLRDSWPLIIAGLSIAVYMKVDQIMLGEMTSDREVGLYATATRLSEMWYFFPMVIAGSVFPAIVKTKESASPEAYQQRMQAFYDVMAAISYGIIIPLTLLASPIVSLLFGPDYEGAGLILCIHIWAFIFVSLGVCRGKWLLAENMTRFAMIATVIGAAANVGLNFLLIPQYSGAGAAWATLIAYMISAYFSSLLIPATQISFTQMTYSLFLPFRVRVLKNALAALKK